MDEVDDSENDSDYVPGKSDTEESENGDNTVHDPALEIANRVRKRKVDSIWEEMVKEDKQYCLENLQKSLNKSKSSNRRTVAQAANANILATIFGKTIASSLLCLDNGPKIPKFRKQPGTLKRNALKFAEGVLKKTKVAEVRRFAGEEVIVEKTVLQSASSVAIAATNKKPQSSLDAALEILKGPKVISTIVKSSGDWDSFKEKEKLQDDLANVSKDGYLARQEFLGRVDIRQFENEKDARILAKPATCRSADEDGPGPKSYNLPLSMLVENEAPSLLYYCDVKLCVTHETSEHQQP